MLPCGTRYHVHPPPIPISPPLHLIGTPKNGVTASSPDTAATICGLQSARHRRPPPPVLRLCTIVILQLTIPPCGPLSIYCNRWLVAPHAFACVSFASLAPFALKPLGVLRVLARDNASFCGLCALCGSKNQQGIIFPHNGRLGVYTPPSSKKTTAATHATLRHKVPCSPTPNPFPPPLPPTTLPIHRAAGAFAVQNSPKQSPHHAFPQPRNSPPPAHPSLAFLSRPSRRLR